MRRCGLCRRFTSFIDEWYCEHSRRRGRQRRRRHLRLLPDTARTPCLRRCRRCIHGGEKTTVRRSVVRARGRMARRRVDVAIPKPSFEGEDELRQDTNRGVMMSLHLLRVSDNSSLLFFSFCCRVDLDLPASMHLSVSVDRSCEVSRTDRRVACMCRPDGLPRLCTSV